MAEKKTQLSKETQDAVKQGNEIREQLSGKKASAAKKVTASKNQEASTAKIEDGVKNSQVDGNTEKNKIT